MTTDNTGEFKRWVDEQIENRLARQKELKVKRAEIEAKEAIVERDLHHLRALFSRHTVTTNTPNDDRSHARMRPAAYRLFGQRREVRTWKDILVGVCTDLYRRSPNDFVKLLNLRTRAGNHHFSREPQQFPNAGEVGDSGIFVNYPNLAADDTIKRCWEIIRHMGLDDEADFDVEAYSS